MSVLSCALPSETVIHLRGSGIAQFLQGQLSCDMRLLSAERTVSGAFCNAKGRVLADLRVLQLAEDHCVMRLRKSIASGCAATLGNYARFSRISCELDDNSFALAGFSGDRAVKIMGALGLERPATADTMTRSGDCVCYFNAPGMLEVLAPSEQIAHLVAAIPEGELCSEEQWQAHTLLQGIYRLESDDVGEFTPQALNFDLAGFVSFNKGCYTGQEIIARLHYKGQTKRRLAIFTTSGNTAPSLERGATLTADSGERAGEFLRSLQMKNGNHVLAVALQSGIDISSPLRLPNTSEESLAPVAPVYPPPN